MGRWPRRSRGALRAGWSPPPTDAASTPRVPRSPKPRLNFPKTSCSSTWSASAGNGAPATDRLNRITTSLTPAQPNEISRASMRGSAAAAAGRSALARPGPFGGLLTDRAPAGSPVIGLLMGCRARPWSEHLIIRVQVSPGAVILTDDMEELVRVLFIGDDWAEDHHDVELEDEGGRGSRGSGCRRAWRASPGCTRWSPSTRRPPGQSFRRSRWPGRWWWGSRPIAARG